MSNSTWVAAVHGAAVLGADPNVNDPFELPGVERLWDWSPTWAFDEMMVVVEPYLEETTRSILRGEADTTVPHPAVARLQASSPPLGQMILLTFEQFGSLQLAVKTAVTQADFGVHSNSIDDFDELAYVRPVGDFVAIIA